METIVQSVLEGLLVVHMDNYYLIVDSIVQCKYNEINDIGLTLLPTQVLILDMIEVESVARTRTGVVDSHWTRETYDEEGFIKTVFVAPPCMVVVTYTNTNVLNITGTLLIGRRVYE